MLHAAKLVQDCIFTGTEQCVCCVPAAAFSGGSPVSSCCSASCYALLKVQAQQLLGVPPAPQPPVSWSLLGMQAQRQFFASELHAAVLAQHCSRLRQLKHMGADLSEWNKV